MTYQYDNPVTWLKSTFLDYFYNNAALIRQKVDLLVCAPRSLTKHLPTMQKKTDLVVPILINKMTKLVINTENGARNQCKVGWITVNVPNK